MTEPRVGWPRRSTVLLLVAFVATLVLYLAVRPDQPTATTPVPALPTPAGTPTTELPAEVTTSTGAPTTTGSGATTTTRPGASPTTAGKEAPTTTSPPVDTNAPTDTAGNGG